MPDRQQQGEQGERGDERGDERARQDGASDAAATGAGGDGAGGDGAGEGGGADKLLRALQEERDARREAERKVRKFEQEQRRIETERAVKAGEWESVANAKDGEIADLNARLADLEAQLAERDAAIVKARVAAKFRLPEPLVARLRGADEAELEADARTLAKLVAPPKAAETEAGRGGPGEGRIDPERERQAQLATGRYRSIA